MQRRRLLLGGGLALGGAVQATRVARVATGDPWADLRAQFNLARDHAHFAGGVFGHHLTPMTAKLTEEVFSDTRDATGAGRKGHLFAQTMTRRRLVVG